MTTKSLNLRGAFPRSTASPPPSASERTGTGAPAPSPRGAGPDRAQSNRTARLATVLLGVTGSVLVCLGAAVLPWVSSFAGLLSLDGTATWHGDLLLVLGTLLGCAALAQAVAPGLALRLAIGTIGFVTVLVAGYLLVNLAAEVRGADGMALLTVGAGLPVVLGGGVLALATLFVPVADGATASGRGSAADLGGAGHRGADRRSTGIALRPLAGVAAVTAAVAHIPVTPEHLREAPYIGVGFLVLTVVLLGLATALVVAQSRAVWLLLACTSAGAVLAYVVSRTVGLPLIGDDVGNWLEPLGVVSVLSETVAAVTALVALRSSARRDAGTGGQPVLDAPRSR